MCVCVHVYECTCELVNFSLYSPIHPLIIFSRLYPQKKPGGHHPDEANQDPAATDAFRPRTPPQWRTHAVSSLWANCLPSVQASSRSPRPPYIPSDPLAMPSAPLSPELFVLARASSAKMPRDGDGGDVFPDRARPSLTRQHETRPGH